MYHPGKFSFVRFATDVQMDVLIEAAHCINVQQFFVFEQEWSRRTLRTTKYTKYAGVWIEHIFVPFVPARMNPFGRVLFVAFVTKHATKVYYTINLKFTPTTIIE